MTPDERLADITLAAIKRHTSNPAAWSWTALGGMHPGLPDAVRLEEGELPLVSACEPEGGAWYVMTTRRVIIPWEGDALREVPLENIRDYQAEDVDVITLFVKEGEHIQIRYETGIAALAPDYALRCALRKIGREAALAASQPPDQESAGPENASAA